MTMANSISGPPSHLRHLADMWDGFSLENKMKPTKMPINWVVENVKAAEAAANDAANKFANDERNTVRDKLVSEPASIVSCLEETEENPLQLKREAKEAHARLDALAARREATENKLVVAECRHLVLIAPYRNASTTPDLVTAPWTVAKQSSVLAHLAVKHAFKTAAT